MCFVCGLFLMCCFLGVRCVCVRVSMGSGALFAARSAMLFGLPLMLVVFCPCVLLDMCRLCV